MKILIVLKASKVNPSFKKATCTTTTFLITMYKELLNYRERVAQILGHFVTAIDVELQPKNLNSCILKIQGLYFD